MKKYIELQDEIIKEYINTQSMEAVAKKYSMWVGTVKSILLKNNISIRNGKRDENLIQQMIFDYENGQIIKDLLKKYRINYKNFNIVLKESNIQKRKMGYHQIGDKSFRYRLINDLDKKKIIQQYLNKDVSVNDILNEYKINFRKIDQILKENNVQRRVPYLSDNENLRNDIIREINNNNFNFKELSRKYNTTHKTIYKILEDEKIEVPCLPNGKKYNRVDIIDGDIFKRRDKEVSYYCGLLAADGTISSRSGNVGLGMIDHEPIYNFCKFLGLPESRIHKKILTHHKWNLKPQYRVDVAHYNFLEDLKYWGVTPNKTYDYYTPQISDDLLASYIRGVFDGDGHVGFNKKTNNANIFQITGNNKSLEFYKKSLLKLGINYNIRLKRTTDVHGVLYIGTKLALNQTFTILKVTPHLSRKWDRINNWLNKK